MLERLLSSIDRIYDLELEVDIEDFLINHDVRRRLSEDNGTSSAVVVHQGTESGEIQLGLYLGEKTLASLRELERDDWIEAEQFSELCTAIEEVSHFAYLWWNATRGKRVTQLELELQAEVDKFITSVVILEERNGAFVPAWLLDRIFFDFDLREGLDASRRHRYLTASSFARSYCSSLTRRFLHPALHDDLLSDLRRFYRLTQRGKIGHIYRSVYEA